MQIYRGSPFYKEKGRTVSIADAVEGSLTDTGYDARGAVEDARDIANKCAEAIGKLTQALHEKGMIDDAVVKSLLGYNYSVEE